MADAIPVWLHLLGAALWIGPQFTLALAATPAIRGVPDDTARAQALRTLTTRFGMLSGAALVLLILTGIDNVVQRAPADMFDLRYGPILVAKLVMVTLALVATAYHAAVVGPPLLKAIEAGDLAAARRLRRRSLAASILNLALGLAILYAAALLRSDFGLAPR